MTGIIQCPVEGCGRPTAGVYLRSALLAYDYLRDARVLYCAVHGYVVGTPEGTRVVYPPFRSDSYRGTTERADPSKGTRTQLTAEPTRDGPPRPIRRSVP